MLLQLEINNIALIEHVCIEFGDGFNVLTGETGAGKSIIIDSISAILGDRLSRDIIRTGKEKATVEAVFHVDNNRFTDLFENTGIEPEDDGTLVISREFTVSGRNICRINGRMVTVSVLKEITSRIIDLHGQHDNQSLLKTDKHIILLDSFAGSGLVKQKQCYTELLGKYNQIRKRLTNLTGDSGERERRIDLLKFQVDEIKKAALKKNEEDELNHQRLYLSNAGKIVASLSAAYDLLFTGNIKSAALDTANEAFSELASVTKYDERIDNFSKRLEEAIYQLSDVIEDIRHERDSIDFDPGMLDQIEERLDLIFRLKRKYGRSIGEVLEFCGKCEKELDELIGSEEVIENFKNELVKVEKDLYTTAVQLHTSRVKAADLLQAKIGSELEQLEFKNARFAVDIVFDGKENKQNCSYTQQGLDRVEFLFSANSGEPLKPLAKIASGGEMSRVMLAVKTILADVDGIPVLVFDEIDTGISGKAAQMVGEKLFYISTGHQILCVTHLTQIAGMAQKHFLIEKITENNSTKTLVKILEGKTRRDEIARLLGGTNTSEITLKHSDEILQNAINKKNTIVKNKQKIG